MHKYQKSQSHLLNSIFLIIKLIMIPVCFLGAASVFALTPQNLTSVNPTVSMNSGVSPITVSTNSQSYNGGDKILVSGTTRDFIQSMPITIIIRNPEGNIVMIDQIPLESNKTFFTTIQTGGSLWQTSGTYEVDVAYGSPDRSATTIFQFAGSKIQPTLNTLAVEGTNFTIPYDITNGKVLAMKIDSQSKSLLVAVDVTDDGALTITLPRDLIDSKTSTQDGQYYVLMDGAEADFEETNTTSTERILTIPFVAGTEEIEIIGTQVVPEFGPIITFVLAIAIVSIITVLLKSRLQFISK